MTALDVTTTYLRIILELEEEAIPVMRARIVERAGISLPMVSQNISRIQRNGLVVSGPDRRLRLTRRGRRLAVAALRKHRLAELLLVTVVGLPHDEAHDEAAHWGQVLSAQAELHIHEKLGRPTHTTCGRPIPGLTQPAAVQT